MIEDQPFWTWPTKKKYLIEKRAQEMVRASNKGPVSSHNEAEELLRRITNPHVDEGVSP